MNWLRTLLGLGGRRASGSAEDPVKRAMRERGLLYSPDVLEDVRARLARVDAKAATALAAACASRLMTAHGSLPSDEQRPFTLGWQGPLTMVWAALQADDPEPSIAGVRQALERFDASPYNHSMGQEGPDDADDDAAAAAIDAAESLCRSEQGASAYGAASRLIDWAFLVAETDLEPPEPHLITMEQSTAEAAHPLVQRELHRLLDGLALLEARGTDNATLEELRKRFLAA